MTNLINFFLLKEYCDTNSLHIVFSNTKLVEFNNQFNNHMIASAYFVNKPYEIRCDELLPNIINIGIRKFLIFYIVDFTQEEIDSKFKAIVIKKNNF